MGLFDVVWKVFVVGEEIVYMLFMDKLDFFFYDYLIVFFFVQENYIYVKFVVVGGDMKKYLMFLSRVVDSICDGDLVDSQIWSK